MLARKVRAGDLKARQKMIEGNAGFAYQKAMKYIYKSAGLAKIDEDDIIQSALIGLIMAVDRYDPDKINDRSGKPYAFTTYAYFWILKIVNEEVSRSHWTTMRPPREALRAFLYSKMTPEGAGEYIETYMRSYSSNSKVQHEVDPSYSWQDLLSIVEQAELDEDEIRVFNSLYGDNQEEDQLTDLSKGELGDIEFTMLEKIRNSL